MATIDQTAEERLLSLDDRLKKVEAELAQVKAATAVHDDDWIAKITGSFKDDPVFDEIVRLGAELRNNEPPAQDMPALED